MPGTRRRLAPDGFAARFALGALVTAGILYANVGPVIVSGLAAMPGFSAEPAGYVLSANMYGAALGGLVVIFLVARLRWRIALTALIVLMAAADLVSTLVHTPLPLATIRFLHGFACGVFLGVGISVIARTRSPERTFALNTGIQVTLGGVGVALLTPLVARVGIDAAWIAFAAYAALVAVLLPWLDDYPERPRSAPSSDVPARAPWLPIALAWAALFLYQAAQMSVFSYMIEFGTRHGFDLGFVGMAVAAGLWIGGPAALLVDWWSTRSGRTKPAFAGILATALSIALLMIGDPIAYAAANVAFGIMWAMTFPYLFGVSAEMDNSGRLAAAGGFVNSIGVASGPAVAALLFADGRVEHVVLVAVAAMLAAACFIVLPARMLDRRSRHDRVEW